MGYEFMSVKARLKEDVVIQFVAEMPVWAAK